jgi:hypothetical protein
MIQETFNRKTNPVLSIVSSQLTTQASPNSNFNPLIIVDIDDRLVPFASRDIPPRQNVDLTEGSVLHLWNPEPRHGDADNRSTSPDLAAPVAQVPLISVKHVAGKEDTRDIDRVVAQEQEAGAPVGKREAAPLSAT